MAMVVIEVDVPREYEDQLVDLDTNGDWVGIRELVDNIGDYSIEVIW